MHQKHLHKNDSVARLQVSHYHINQLVPWYSIANFNSGAQMSSSILRSPAIKLVSTLKEASTPAKIWVKVILNDFSFLW